MRAALLAVLTLSASMALANGRPPAARSVHLDPARPGALIVGTTFGALFSPVDEDGWRWVCELSIGYSASVDPVFLRLANGALAATTPDGLSLSNAGCSWNKQSATEGTAITDLVIHPTDPTRLFATTDAPSGRLLRFSAYGENLETKLLVLDGRRVSSVRIAPNAPDQIYVASDASGAAGRVHHSADAGRTWTAYELEGASPRVLAVAPDDPAVVFVSVEGALLRSEDAAVTFVPVLDRTIGQGALHIEPGSSVVWAAGEAAGVLVSSDGGRTFEPSPGSPHGPCITKDGPTVYACADYALDAHVLGRFDGSSWRPEIEWFDAIAGPLVCPAGTPTQYFCEDLWNTLQPQFGGNDETPEVTNPVPQPPKDDGCGCASSSGAALAWPLLLLLVRRRRRARS